MKKILVTSIGGLGNQMFCYAFFVKLKSEHQHMEFKMDLSSVWDRRYSRNAEFLSVFPNIKLEEASVKEIWENERKLTFTYRGKGSRIIRNVVDRCNAILMKKNREKCITEEKYALYRSGQKELNWEEILYVDGFWQQIADYKEYLSQLKKDFVFKEIEDEENKKMLQQIQEEESISVHVRRGDYVGETLDILDTGYYTGIIRELQTEFPGCRFYFFTNDAEYVEKEYEWLESKVIVKHNAGLNSFRDMQLMSACKHNVIANSTFSIWAALLNSNETRRVYYPSHYYKGIEMQNIDLKGFIKVKVNGEE